MSDIAIKYYEVIYKGLIADKIVKEDGLLANREFAGDTMNGFHCIANITPEAGRTKASRTPESEWPTYLLEYYQKYHCLANFWVLPFNLGRRGKKLNYYDSIDLYLVKLMSNFNHYKMKYPNYFKQVSEFPDYCDIHSVECRENENFIRELYRTDSENLIGYIMDNIKLRAECLAKKRGNELIALFRECGLIHEN